MIAAGDADDYVGVTYFSGLCVDSIYQPFKTAFPMGGWSFCQYVIQIGNYMLQNDEKVHFFYGLLAYFRKKV